MRCKPAAFICFIVLAAIIFSATLRLDSRPYTEQELREAQERLISNLNAWSSQHPEIYYECGWYISTIPEDLSGVEVRVFELSPEKRKAIAQFAENPKLLNFVNYPGEMFAARVVRIESETQILAEIYWNTVSERPLNDDGTPFYSHIIIYDMPEWLEAGREILVWGNDFSNPTYPPIRGAYRVEPLEAYTPEEVTGLVKEIAIPDFEHYYDKPCLIIKVEDSTVSGLPDTVQISSWEIPEETEVGSRILVRWGNSPADTDLYQLNAFQIELLD